MSSLVSDTKYLYLALNTSGDTYYGYTYADTGSYYLGQWVSASVSDNDGGSWTYYIYESEDYGYDTGYEGYSYGYYYYDQDSDGGYLSSTSYAGYGGIGSEYGYTANGEYWGNHGAYEADVPLTDSVYYFYALNSSGDSYYGYSYAYTGTYYVGQTIYASVTDNDGGSWSYYVYDSVDFGDNSLTEGISTGYDYYDYDGGGGYLSSTSYNSSGGIGSEWGYTSDGQYWGMKGAYEADGAKSDSIYYFYALNTNGDSYYGYSYADTGTYYEGQTIYASNYDNDGGSWSYYVYDSYDYSYDSTYDGYSYGYDYYDYDGGGGYLSSSSSSNDGGIGSEYGRTSDGQDWGYYGLYEADVVTDSIYYFYALNTSGDSYYGYTYADTGKYYEGQTVYAADDDNDGGNWSYHIYDVYDYGYETGYEYYSYGYDYYDQDGGGGYLSSTSYSNIGGLGSEYGTTSDGQDWGYYGSFEADGQNSDTLYYYVAYNTAGDSYYGYTYADTGTYSEGQYVYASTYDNDGGYWYYYVYDSYDYGYETGYEGYSYGYNYYDDDAGGGYVSSTSYYGYGGMGSEYGYTSDGQTWGYYGYHEADAQLLGSLNYFYAVNTNGDSYYGYSYDNAGTYYKGQTIYASVYDNDGSYWSYYVYETYDYVFESIYDGYSYGYNYYDQDGGGGYLSSTSYSNYWRDRLGIWLHVRRSGLGFLRLL